MRVCGIPADASIHVCVSMRICVRHATFQFMCQQCIAAVAIGNVFFYICSCKGNADEKIVIYK